MITFFGKTLINFGLVYWDKVNFVLIAGITIFGVPMRGSLLVLFLAALTFVCSAVAVGTLISTFAKNLQQSMLGGMLFTFPAILLSGLMFPIENMPMFMRAMAYLDPIYYFLLLLRNIMLKGGEIHFIIFHISVLILMAMVSVYISFKRFHTTLQKKL
jgi:ABC-2 type transport system permease protein